MAPAVPSLSKAQVSSSSKVSTVSNNMWLGRGLLDGSAIKAGMHFNGEVMKVLKHGFFVRFGDATGVSPKDGFVKMKKTHLKEGGTCRVEVERIHGDVRSPDVKFDIMLLE